MISTRPIIAALAVMVCSSPSQAIDVLGGATYGTPAGCVRHDPDAALALMQSDPADRAVRVTDRGIDTADLACSFYSAEPEGRSWKVETMCYQGDDEAISDYLLTEDRTNGILKVEGDIGPFTLQLCR